MKYECINCKKDGRKLWREYQCFRVELHCAPCLAQLTGVDISTLDAEGTIDRDGRRTDQLGWWIPAIPADGGKSFWAYTSVPDDDFAAWTALPSQ